MGWHRDAQSLSQETPQSPTHCRCAPARSHSQPAARREKDFTLLDIYQNTAVAKVIASDWVDYLQLARWNGRWVIVNVLWELKPRT